LAGAQPNRKSGTLDGQKDKTMRILLAFICLTACATAAADGSSFRGTWKEDLKKSHADGRSATYEQLPSGLIRVTGGTFDYEFRTDGKDYPTIGGGVTVSWTAAGKNTWDLVRKDGGGKIISKGGAVLSDDGKTKTITTTYLMADGKSEQDTVVWDRLSGGPGLAGKWRSNGYKSDTAELLIVSIPAPGEIKVERPQSKEVSQGKLDGTDMPVSGTQVPQGATSTLKVIDAHRMDTQLKIKGKIITTGHWILSPDGRTLEIVTWVPGHENEKVFQVYDRQ
jgi:hypothetical protein